MSSIITGGGYAAGGSFDLSMGDQYHTGASLVLTSAAADVSCDRSTTGGGSGRWRPLAVVGGRDKVVWVAEWGGTAVDSLDYAPTFTSAGDVPIVYVWMKLLYDNADGGTWLDVNQSFSIPTAGPDPVDIDAAFSGGPFTVVGVTTEGAGALGATVASPYTNEVTHAESGFRLAGLAYTTSYVDGSWDTSGASTASGHLVAFRTQTGDPPPPVPSEGRKWWVGVVGWGSPPVEQG